MQKIFSLLYFHPVWIHKARYSAILDLHAWPHHISSSSGSSNRWSIVFRLHDFFIFFWVVDVTMRLHSDLLFCGCRWGEWEEVGFGGQ